jgi:ATP-dependent Clp protease protease subunit
MNTIKLFSDINTRTTDIFRRADDTQPLYVALDSVGGSVYEAFKIYDLIRERQQPTFVNVVGYCYSAASVILLAASAERRTASANASFLIHSPFLCESEPDQHLTIEKAESYTAEMKAMDNKLRALYLERTTADEVTINNLMKAETIFGANSAKNWGFISSINDYQNLFNMSKLKQVLFDAFGIQMKAMKVVGADGKELEINKDSGAPAVGDVVTSDDGEYLQNDGTTIVVKDGKISEIKPAEKKDGPETPAAPAEPSTDPNAEEIDKLKKECQNLSKRLTEMENNAVSTADVVELVNELGGKDALLALKNAKGKEAPKNVDMKNKVETEEERLMKMSAEEWAKYLSK